MKDPETPKQKLETPGVSSRSVWIKRLGKVLDIGGDAADILVHVRDFTPTSVASLGLRLVNSVRGRLAQTPSDYFRGDDWQLLETFGFSEYLYKVCLSICKSKRVDGLDDECEEAVITDLNGTAYGWIIRQNELSNELSEGPFILSGVDRIFAQQELGKMIWEHIGSKSCVLCSDKDKKAVFQAEEEIELFESQLSMEMLGRANLFIEKGMNRSVLLLGEPGTGKSCMMRYMAKQMAGFSLRISINDLQDINRRDLMSALFLLAPDVVLVDDFDRLSNSEGFLSDLEEINRRIKLFMVSCNSVSEIDDAVIRPGRFDEMHIIDHLDPEIVFRIVGNIDEDTAYILKQLPIAYVVEFEKRRKALGQDAALIELKELVQRSHKLESLRKRKPRKIRYRRTPAKIAKMKRERVLRITKEIENEKGYIVESKKSVIPKLNEKLKVAEARADEAEKRAELYKEEGKRKAAKKAAKTRELKKKLKDKAQKVKKSAEPKSDDNKEGATQKASKADQTKPQKIIKPESKAMLQPADRDSIIDFATEARHRKYGY